MKIAREEIFGPVLSIIRFETEAEAVQLANASIYGLQARVWSDNINRAHRVARALRAGTVHVNQYDEDDITVPFGGFKQSGNGRDKSLHAFDKYTELKTTWLRIEGAPAHARSTTRAATPARCSPCPGCPAWRASWAMALSTTDLSRPARARCCAAR
jgi:hypothetical protein